MKNVGISQRVILNKNNSRLDSLEQDYIRYYSKFFINLIPIPNVVEDVSEYIEKNRIEIIILSGGGEISSDFSRHPEKSELFYQPERDFVESELLKYAVKHKIPVIGECRGAQFINLFFGGTLINSISDNLLNSNNHVATNHEIEIVDDKFDKFFIKNKFDVNSFHENGFTKDGLSSQLKEFAISSDGVVEGFYHIKLPIVGIMWHPERMENKMSNKEINYNLLNNLLNY
ncbi:MAG: gamma-glutamyl-gamma-aminobutyrate hydrolase family protein [Patescibacteria group bacterium]|nr:gamma-glutamyl-gamma-aminobutyrate hydrolase family protein [Patescibacteria group bacterium]